MDPRKALARQADADCAKARRQWELNLISEADFEREARWSDIERAMADAVRVDPFDGIPEADPEYGNIL